MTLPNREQAEQIVSEGSPFWIVVIVVWTLMIVTAGTLALALGIWNLIEAF